MGRFLWMASCFIHYPLSGTQRISTSVFRLLCWSKCKVVLSFIIFLCCSFYCWMDTQRTTWIKAWPQNAEPRDLSRTFTQVTYISRGNKRLSRFRNAIISCICGLPRSNYDQLHQWKWKSWWLVIGLSSSSVNPPLLLSVCRLWKCTPMNCGERGKSCGFDNEWPGLRWLHSTESQTPSRRRFTWLPIAYCGRDQLLMCVSWV